MVQKKWSFVGIVPLIVLIHLAVTFHKELAHLEKYNLSEALTSRIWNPSLNNVVNEVCITCKNCQLFKIGHQEPSHSVLKIKSKLPFGFLANDCVSFQKSKKSNTVVFMLLIISVNGYLSNSLKIRRDLRLPEHLKRSITT